MAQVHFRISLINRRTHTVYFDRIRVALPSFTPHHISHLTGDDEIRWKSVDFEEVKTAGVFTLTSGEIRRMEIDGRVQNSTHKEDWATTVQDGIPNPW